MDAEQIAALPEARAYAEWLNAQAAAREAVIEAARHIRQGFSASRVWNSDEIRLSIALAQLDGLNPPSALDDTQPNASTQAIDVSAYLADQARRD